LFQSVLRACVSQVLTDTKTRTSNSSEMRMVLNTGFSQSASGATRTLLACSKA